MTPTASHQSSSHFFVMPDEEGVVGADVYPWPRSPITHLDAQIGAMKIGRVVTGETARDEPRALPRRQHRGSPKGHYHDWRSTTHPGYFVAPGRYFTGLLSMLKKGIVDEEDLIVTLSVWQAWSPPLALRASGLLGLPGQRI